jgi:hypothetical protein
VPLSVTNPFVTGYGFNKKKALLQKYGRSRKELKEKAILKRTVSYWAQFYHELFQNPM